MFTWRKPSRRRAIRKIVPRAYASRTKILFLFQQTNTQRRLIYRTYEIMKYTAAAHVRQCTITTDGDSK